MGSGTCGGANHCTLHLPSIAIQTLTFRVLPVPCPPHCLRAVCSVFGTEWVGINSFFLGASTVSPRQRRSVTRNASITLPTAKRSLRCALLAPRIQRASDLAAVPPALVKGIWQSSPSKPLSSPASDEFRLCLTLSPHSPSHKVSYQRGSHCQGRLNLAGQSLGPHTWLVCGVQAPHPRILHRCRGARTTGNQSSSPGTLPRANPWASRPACHTPLHCGPSADLHPGWCWPRTSTFSLLASNSPLSLGYLNVSEESLPPF